MAKQLILEERFTSIQQAQAGLTRLLEKAEKDEVFYRVLRNNKPLGVLLPNRSWESILEDLEALSSERYLRGISQSRRSQKRYSAEAVKKILNL